MSPWLQRSRQRTVAFAVLVASVCAAAGCGADAPRSELPDDVAADTPAPAPAASDTPAAQAPALVPDSAIPDPGAVAAPVPPPVQAAEDRPRVSTPSEALRDRIARRGVAQVVQGLAQLEMGPRLAPADYLRVELMGSDFRQEALTSASGEFFFKSVPAGAAYSIWFTTLDKEARIVHNVNQLQIGAGELVRIGPFRIPFEAVKVRR